jgi:hypothetical protein
MSTIKIGFANNTNVYELPKSIVKFYPNSILSLYESVESDETITLPNITYEQFGQIYDVLMGKRKQWTIPDGILYYMDMYGLVNDTLLKLHRHFVEKKEREMNKVNGFLEKGNLFLPKDKKEYNYLKDVFSGNKNIMSVQISYLDGEIQCINILEQVPIYYRADKPNKIPHLDNMTDINMMRYHMIVNTNGCDKCVCCNKCEGCVNDSNDSDESDNDLLYDDIDCKDCIICDDHKHYSPKHRHKLGNFYTNKPWEYMIQVHRFIISERDINYNGIQSIKSQKENILNWSTVATPRFLENITQSLEKIVDFIFKNRDYIETYYSEREEDSFYSIRYHTISCCNGPIDIPVTTYYVFVNFDNIT